MTQMENILVSLLSTLNDYLVIMIAILNAIGHVIVALLNPYDVFANSFGSINIFACRIKIAPCIFESLSIKLLGFTINKIQWNNVIIKCNIRNRRIEFHVDKLQLQSTYTISVGNNMNPSCNDEHLLVSIIKLFICYIYKVALRILKRVLSISFSFEIILSNNPNIQCIVHLQDTISIFNIEGNIGLETTFINDGTFSNRISLINNSYSVTSCEMDVDSGNYSSLCLLFRHKISELTFKTSITKLSDISQIFLFTKTNCSDKLHVDSSLNINSSSIDISLRNSSYILTLVSSVLRHIQPSENISVSINDSLATFLKRLDSINDSSLFEYSKVDYQSYVANNWIDMLLDYVNYNIQIQVSLFHIGKLHIVDKNVTDTHQILSMKGVQFNLHTPCDTTNVTTQNLTQNNNSCVKSSHIHSNKLSTTPKEMSLSLIISNFDSVSESNNIPTSINKTNCEQNWANIKVKLTQHTDTVLSISKHTYIASIDTQIQKTFIELDICTLNQLLYLYTGFKSLLNSLVTLSQRIIQNNRIQEISVNSINIISYILDKVEIGDIEMSLVDADAVFSKNYKLLSVCFIGVKCFDDKSKHNKSTNSKIISSEPHEFEGYTFYNTIDSSLITTTAVNSLHASVDQISIYLYTCGENKYYSSSNSNNNYTNSNNSNNNDSNSNNKYDAIDASKNLCVVIEQFSCSWIYSYHISILESILYENNNSHEEAKLNSAKTSCSVDFSRMKFKDVYDWICSNNNNQNDNNSTDNIQNSISFNNEQLVSINLDSFKIFPSSVDILQSTCIFTALTHSTNLVNDACLSTRNQAFLPLKYRTFVQLEQLSRFASNTSQNTKIDFRIRYFEVAIAEENKVDRDIDIDIDIDIEQQRYILLFNMNDIYMCVRQSSTTVNQTFVLSKASSIHMETCDDSIHIQGNCFKIPMNSSSKKNSLAKNNNSWSLTITPFEIDLLSSVDNNNQELSPKKKNVLFTSIFYDNSIGHMSRTHKVVVDTSDEKNSTNVLVMIESYYYCSRVYVPPIHISAIAETDSFHSLQELQGASFSNYNYMFSLCNKLELIDLIYASDDEKSIRTLKSSSQIATEQLYLAFCARAHLPTLHEPNQMLFINVSKLNISLYHKENVVLVLNANRSSLAYITFGNYLSQINGVINEIEASESSMQTSLHDRFIYSFDNSNNSSSSGSSSNATTTSSSHNRLEFHITSRIGVKPLIEVIVENMRVIYLQRTLLTLISYFRDHLISSIKNSYEHGKRKKLLEFCRHARNDDSTSDTNNMANVRNISIVKEGYAETVPIVDTNCLFKSHMRLSVVARQIELHFPVSSCGADSLTLLVPQLTVYSSRTKEENEYCKGPFLNKSMWISEYDHIQKLSVFMKNNLSPTSHMNSSTMSTSNMQYNIIVPSIMSGRHNMKSKTQHQQQKKHMDTNINASSTSVTNDSFSPKEQQKSKFSRQGSVSHVTEFIWNLPQYTDGLKAPSEMSDMNFERYFAKLENFTLATWCNKNCIGSNMTGHVIVSVFPTTPLTRDLHEFTTDDDDIDDDCDYIFGKEPFIFPIDEIRNTVTIGLRIQPLDWIVTQGQYATICNFLTQSFSEFQETVLDKYVPPSPVTVPLTEDIYGREVPEELLPLVTSVPLKFLGRGRLLALINEREYYDLISRIQINPDKYICEGPNCDSVPSWSCHHFYRKKLFTRSQPFASSSSVKSYASFNSYYHCQNLQKPLFCIHFDDLSVHFFRKHGGGGNGLNVNATSLVISEPRSSTSFDSSLPHKQNNAFTSGLKDLINNSKTVNKEEEKKTSKIELEPCWLNIQDIPAAKVIYAPRNLPQLNQIATNSSSTENRDFISSSSSQMANENATANIKKSSDDFTKQANETDNENDKFVGRHHYIQYHQQNIANLRRCVVNIQDSVFVVHLLSLTNIINFFFESIQLSSQRALAFMSRLGIPQLDFKANLDVEAMTKRTIFCFPKAETTSALCVEVNLTYKQLWRGFLLSGPGCRIIDMKTKIGTMFIAPLNEIKINSSIDTLIDPCEIDLFYDLKVLSDESSLNTKLDILQKFMTFSEWCQTTSKKARGAIAKSLIIFKIFPTNPNAILEHVYESLNQLRSYHLPVSLSAPSLESTNDQEISSSNTANSSEIQTLELRFGLKDFQFFLDIVSQFQNLLTNNLPKRAKLISIYESQFLSFADIHHLPLPSYYHPTVEYLNDADSADTEIIVTCPPELHIILRNNTYNIKIAKLELSNFQFSNSQSHSDKHVYMASSGQFSAWSYNEFSTFWEPVIEKSSVTVIAASDDSYGLGNMAEASTPVSFPHNHDHDSSMNSFNATESIESSNKPEYSIRYDIFCTPIDINICQKSVVGLIRKITLPDVLATSSIYLPPYRIINQLGVAVTCKISCGSENDSAVILNEIPVDGSVPIDRNRLMEAKKRSSRLNNNYAGHSEHCLDIDFIIENELFCSKESIPIDREGISSFDMKRLRRPSPRPETESVNEKSNIKQDFQQNASSVNQNDTFASSSNSIYTPYVIANMFMKSDGGRELVLRSVVSFKNLMSEPVHVMVKRKSDSTMTHNSFNLANNLSINATNATETLIQPNEEWYVPLLFAHPQSSLLIRMNDSLHWIEVLSSLQSLILQGRWGLPTKLKAEICACDPDDTISESYGDWVVLLKPEVRSNFSNGEALKSFLTVVYPSKESTRFAPTNASMNSGNDIKISKDVNSALTSSVEQNFSIDDYFGSSSNANYSNRVYQVPPMCIQLLPPLQISSVCSQPLLYRIADLDGLVTNEGVILPGEIVDFHNLSILFTQQLYLSLRMLNYRWSKWMRLFSRSNPYPSTEKVIDVNLLSMDLTYQSAEIHLPSLDLNLSMREHLVRISCPIIISNRTGFQLDFSESGAGDSCFIPLSSKSSAEEAISMTLDAQTTRKKALTIMSPFHMQLTPSHGSEAQQQVSPLNMMLSPVSKLGPAENDQIDSDEDDASEDKSVDNSRRDHLNFSRRSLKSIEMSQQFDNSFVSENDAVSVSSPSSSVHRLSTFSVDFMDTGPFSPQPPLKLFVPDSEYEKRSSSGEFIPKPALPLIKMIIHMPFDHFKVTQVLASPDWTLQELFMYIQPKIASSTNHQHQHSYVFFTWDQGKYGPQKIMNTPALEAGKQKKNESSSTEKHLGISLDYSSVGERSQKNDISNAINAGAERAALKLSSFLGLKTPAVSSNSTKTLTTTINATHDNSNTVSHATTEIPALMQYDMVSDCSFSNIPMNTKIGTLKSTRLRLCHIAEWSVYRQVCAIKTDTIQKEGVFQMFLSSKFKYRVPFMKFDGTIPFNPPRRFLANVSLSLRVPNETDWSSTIDLIGASFGTGGDSIRLQNNIPNDTKNKLLTETQYDFGVFAEKGKGFYQNVTSISIVPKYIIISKINTFLELRQLNCQDPLAYVNVTPESVQSFHFPFKKKEKILQIRRIASSHLTKSRSLQSGQQTLSNSSYDINNTAKDDEEAYSWYGEIDISSLGMAYVKLRNPLYIMKIQIEKVGASFVATCCPSNEQWPPYRIENKTSMEIRFRQNATKSKLTNQNNKSSSSVFTTSSDEKLDRIDESSVTSSPTAASRTSTATVNNTGDDINPLPWDFLVSNSNVAFTWDFPKSIDKMLRVEFKQMSKTGDLNNYVWVGDNIQLDSDNGVTGTKSITLKKNIFMSNTSAESSVMMYDKVRGLWTKRFCVLQGINIFVFRDASQTDLIDIVNLVHYSLPLSIPNTKQTAFDNNSDSSIMSIAYITRKEEIAKESLSELRGTGSLSSYGFFSGLSESVEAAALAMSQSISTSSQNLKTAQSKIDINRARVLQLRLSEAIGLFGKSNCTSTVVAKQLNNPTYGSSKNQAADTFISNTTPSSILGTYKKLQSGSTLLAHLKAHIFIDQLMDKVEKLSFSMSDLVDAVIDIGEALTIDDAIDWIFHLYENNLFRCKSVIETENAFEYLNQQDISQEPLQEENGVSDEHIQGDVDQNRQVNQDESQHNENNEKKFAKSHFIAAAEKDTYSSSNNDSLLPSENAINNNIQSDDIIFQPGSNVTNTLNCRNFPSLLRSPQFSKLLRLTGYSQFSEKYIKKHKNKQSSTSFTPMSSFGSLEKQISGLSATPGPSENIGNSDTNIIHTSAPTIIGSSNNDESYEEDHIRNSEEGLDLTIEEGLELQFCVPSLIPELIESNEAIMEESDASTQYLEQTIRSISKELRGFSLTINEGKHYFLFASEFEYVNFVTQCRKSIESAWTVFQTADIVNMPNVNLSLEAFKHEIKVQVYPDGPTSVLVLSDDSMQPRTASSPANLRNKTREALSLNSKLNHGNDDDDGDNGDEIVVSSAISENTYVAASINKKQSANNYIDNNHKWNVSNLNESVSVKGKHTTTVGVYVKPQSMNWGCIYTQQVSSTQAPVPIHTFPPNNNVHAKAIRKRLAQQLQNRQVAISTKLDSVTLSIVDSEPSELLYISFNDIEISAENTFEKLKLAVTVQDFQICNQLLNPSYPVLLHSRMLAKNANHDVQNISRLQLPFLHQRDSNYPCLHLFVQVKKYHEHIDKSASISDNKNLTNNLNNNNRNRSKSSNYHSQGNLHEDQEHGNFPKMSSHLSSSGHDESSLGNKNIETMKETNLYYFELATIWLAPMLGNLDDEIIVRTLRVAQAINTIVKQPNQNSQHNFQEEILALQHQGNKTWGIIDRKNMSKNFYLLQEAGKTVYVEYNPLGKASTFIYFSLLQLHPLDIVINFRSLTGYNMTGTESAVVSIIQQIESSRICLNALIAEHAFGSTIMITDIIAKHYKAALWRQIHKIMGTSVTSDPSANDVTSNALNLGSGVSYDAFYEPIDGLTGDNPSFLDGISKGSKTFASRAIGGAGLLTSKLTGSLGHGASLLTFDSEFYRKRVNRRLIKAKSVSQGIYVGTKELGKNIAEGVSGLVASPYYGYQENGATGLASGLAKGLLGVALKPAVGVFDLASRTTEGIRHTAYGNNASDEDEVIYNVTRKRIPRNFGKNGILFPYSLECSAAQYIGDKLTGFIREPRLLVLYHQNLVRRIIAIDTSVDMSTVNSSLSILKKSQSVDTSNSSESVIAKQTSPQKESVTSGLLIYKDTGSEDFKERSEYWGMSVGQSFIVLVSLSKIILVKLSKAVTSHNTIDSHSSSSELKTKNNTSIVKPIFSLIWSCPARLVNEICCDSHGDLLLSLALPLSTAGNWNSQYPVILDLHAQDYLIFQLLLEQTVGLNIARQQPLMPIHGLIETNVLKKSSSGLKSMLLIPTKHTYQLYGYVLYEYSQIPKNEKVIDMVTKSSNTKNSSSANSSSSGTGHNHNNDSKNYSELDMGKKEGDEYISRIVYELFTRTNASSLSSQEKDMTILEEAYKLGTLSGVFLQHVYPLVDLVLSGPYQEDQGKFSISIQKKDGSKMRALRKEDENTLFCESLKPSLTMLFSTRQSALTWRQKLEQHMVRQSKTDSMTGPVVLQDQQDIIKRYSQSQNSFPTLKSLQSYAASTVFQSSNVTAFIDHAGAIETHSIVSTLVIPTAGEKHIATEALKIEIANAIKHKL